MFNPFLKITRLYRNITEGIKNLIIWFPVIWNDRQWDHYFIYKILHKKLDLAEHFFRYNGNHLNAEDDADKIKVCVILLDRLLKDEYDTRAFKDFYKKWGEIELTFTDSENYPDMYECHTKAKNVKTKDDEIQERKDFKSAKEKENYSRQNDINYLFEMMKRHIEGWWD